MSLDTRWGQGTKDSLALGLGGLLPRPGPDFFPKFLLGPLGGAAGVGFVEVSVIGILHKGH